MEILIFYLPTTGKLKEFYDSDDRFPNIQEGNWVTHPATRNDPAWEGVLVDAPSSVQECRRMFAEEKAYLLKQGQQFAQARQANQS